MTGVTCPDHSQRLAGFLETSKDAQDLKKLGTAGHGSGHVFTSYFEIGSH